MSSGYRSSHYLKGRGQSGQLCHFGPTFSSNSARCYCFSNSLSRSSYHLGNLQHPPLIYPLRRHSADKRTERASAAPVSGRLSFHIRRGKNFNVAYLIQISSACYGKVARAIQREAAVGKVTPPRPQAGAVAVTRAASANRLGRVRLRRRPKRPWDKPAPKRRQTFYGRRPKLARRPFACTRPPHKLLSPNRPA